jgi:hypothetical protein
MDHSKAIYLRLAPEFGEARFGPYENCEIRIGSDESNCAILIADFGALPIHAKLTIEGEKNFILSPSERSAEIFLWRKNKRPELIHSATAVKPGDAFSIVTDNGPKFIIELDELPEEIKEQRENEASRRGTGRSRLSADSMKTEAKRQVWTQFLVMGPMQLLQRAWIYIKSGAIYQPRNIIAGAVLISGWIVGGGSACRTKKLQTEVSQVKKTANNCQNQLKFHESLTQKKDYGIIDAIYGISRSPQLTDSLKKDKKLMNLVKEKSLTLISQDSPDWLVTKTKSPYAKQFKRWIAAVRSIDDNRIDPETKNLLIWNINQEDQSNRDFDLIQNPKGDRFCGRGIMQLTFRQAIYLGLEAKPDASFKGSVADLLPEDKSSQLRSTIVYALGSEINVPESQTFIDALIDANFEAEQLFNRSQQNCIYLEGPDERINNLKMLRKLQKMIGPKAKGMPAKENYLSSTARIAKLYLADLEDMDYRKPNKKVKFKGTLDASLASLGQEGKWVMEQTAETIAQSLVLPCRVALEGTEDAKKNVGGEEFLNLPDPIACLVFDWKIRNE